MPAFKVIKFYNRDLFWLSHYQIDMTNIGSEIYVSDPGGGHDNDVCCGDDDDQ